MGTASLNVFSSVRHQVCSHTARALEGAGLPPQLPAEGGRRGQCAVCCWMPSVLPDALACAAGDGDAETLHMPYLGLCFWA